MTYRLDFRRYALPLRVPLRTAQGPWIQREGLILRLTDAAGRVGFGEAAPISWFRTESLAAIEAAVQTLGAHPAKEALTQLPPELGVLRGAVGAALRALADTGSATGAQPAGVSSPPALPVAALLPAGRASLAEVDAKLELGFRCFKWKVGVMAAADEWGILDDLLARFPSGARLRLDANGAWDRRTAERWLERSAERPIEHVEQPVDPGGRGAEDLLLGLASDYPTPVALDESLGGQRDLEHWVRAGWPGVYVLKPALLSDPSGALAALGRAKARVVFSSALETAVGARHALRWAFGWTGERRALGFGVWPLFADGRFDGPFAAPFLRWEDVDRLDPAVVWSLLDGGN